MLGKKEIKEIITTGLILFLITAISAGVLAIVNDVTAPIIAENEKIKQENAMKVVLPDADTFEAVTFDTDKVDNVVSEIFKAPNSAGYVVMVSPSGYGGKISLAVGVDSENKVSGVSVISQAETAGLGAKCTSEEFTSQFIGKTEEIVVVKNSAKDNQINAISSATITSKAVTSGVNAAISAVKIVKEGK